MKRAFIAVGLTLVAVGVARADSIWIDPSGEVSLHLPDNWVVVDPSEPAARYDGDVLTARPADPDTLAQCNVGIKREPLPVNPTRERLNDATEQFRLNFIEEHRPEIDSLTMNSMAGVSVLDMVNSTARLRTISRRFFLRSPNELRLYTIGCSAALSDSAAMTAAHGVTDSLRINETQAHP